MEPEFFKLKTDRDGVNEAFRAFRVFIEEGQIKKCKKATITFTTEVKDEEKNSRYRMILTTRSHVFHGNLPQQYFEIRINWEHKGFTVQYWYDMQKEGEDENIVIHDLLYMPSMAEMDANVSAWVKFSSFVKEIADSSI